MLARDLPGADIARAFDEALRPRLERRQDAAGTAVDPAALPRLRGYLTVDRLGKGAEILFCCRPPELLAVVAAGTEHEPLHSRPLCEVLFDLYLGSGAALAAGQAQRHRRLPGTAGRRAIVHRPAGTS